MVLAHHDDATIQNISTSVLGGRGSQDAESYSGENKLG